MAVVICSLSELPDPSTREFSIGTGDWPLRGFVVHYQSAIRAYLNSCPHAGLPLNFKPHVFFAPYAPLLQCVAHGALFEPQTGECVLGPCVGHKLRALDIDVSDGYIYLRSQLGVLESYWV